MESSPFIEQFYSLQVPSDLQVLTQVMFWFEHLERPAISPQIWVQCQTMLAEGLTNAIRHAHQDRDNHLPIDLEVAISYQRITIRIWDYGPAFDLEEKLKELPKIVDQGQCGGRGLWIMQQLADHLEYRRINDQRNCLVMVKHLASVGES